MALTTRKLCNIRKTNRYQTDVTGKEWHLIEPHLPAMNIAGRPRAWPMREIINGIFYVMRSGCPWRLLPSDLPPWSTMYRWFAKFRDEGRSNGSITLWSCPTANGSAAKPVPGCEDDSRASSDRG